MTVSLCVCRKPAEVWDTVFCIRMYVFYPPRTGTHALLRVFCILIDGEDIECSTNMLWTLVCSRLTKKSSACERPSGGEQQQIVLSICHCLGISEWPKSKYLYNYMSSQWFCPLKQSKYIGVVKINMRVPKNERHIKVNHHLTDYVFYILETLVVCFIHFSQTICTHVVFSHLISPLLFLPLTLKHWRQKLRCQALAWPLGATCGSQSGPRTLRHTDRREDRNTNPGGGGWPRYLLSHSRPWWWDDTDVIIMICLQNYTKVPYYAIFDTSSNSQIEIFSDMPETTTFNLSKLPQKLLNIAEHLKQDLKMSDYDLPEYLRVLRTSVSSAGAPCSRYFRHPVQIKITKVRSLIWGL